MSARTIAVIALVFAIAAFGLSVVSFFARADTDRVAEGLRNVGTETRAVFVNARDKLVAMGADDDTTPAESTTAEEMEEATAGEVEGERLPVEGEGAEVTVVDVDEVETGSEPSLANELKIRIEDIDRLIRDEEGRAHVLVEDLKEDVEGWSATASERGQEIWERVGEALGEVGDRLGEDAESAQRRLREISRDLAPRLEREEAAQREERGETGDAVDEERRAALEVLQGEGEAVLPRELLEQLPTTTGEVDPNPGTVDEALEFLNPPGAEEAQ